jgi:hypothetical protein
MSCERQLAKGWLFLYTDLHAREHDSYLDLKEWAGWSGSTAWNGPPGFFYRQINLLRCGLEWIDLLEERSLHKEMVHEVMAKNRREGEDPCICPPPGGADEMVHEDKEDEVSARTWGDDRKNGQLDKAPS